MVNSENVSRLHRWIEEMAALCQPERVHLCDGSEEEFDAIAATLVQSNLFVPLKRPHSFWCHSHPDDVARVEEDTFICSKRKEDAGPTNNWADPEEMKRHLYTLFRGCMKGRTLYVVPYCMGPLQSRFSLIGVQITDSPYAVLNMKIMTRMGKEAIARLGDGFFSPGIHSVGAPLQDVPWPCNPEKRVIAHFPEERSVWSFGSGYGGNALLGKKCLALRLASVIAKEEGWLAEHMLLLGITNPEGEKKYFAAAFPSACGKTNLAMMTPSLPGWKIETVGDDIAWIFPNAEGGLSAINPECGYFGVAPGTSMRTNPNAMRAIEKNTLFTNVALTADRDVWWEGMDTPPPSGLLSWLGTPWDPTSNQPAAHPNSRFTVPAKQNPIYDPAAEHPDGVPLSAILFGGRRSSTLPLVFEAFHWQHGTFLGASLSSETTAAAEGERGKLRHDPFAMLPFCGYHMGDYFAHWLKMGQHRSPPRIFAVNWFRKGTDGRYLWPGFGENSRVLKWIFERTSHRANAQKSLIGYLPFPQDFSLSEQAFAPLFSLDKKDWLAECDGLASYFRLFGDRMPQPLLDELSALRRRIENFSSTK